MAASARVQIGVLFFFISVNFLPDLAGATARSEALPGYHWRTLETPHFSVHFHQEEELMARRVAELGEEIYTELTPFMKWTPRGKTQVVLVANRDDFNAWSTTVPFREMKIFLVPPPATMDFDSSDDWLRLTLFHEYTHILHLDTVDGIPKYLRYFFGSIVSYGFFSPTWYLEGLATYGETRFTGEGRIGAPLTEMVLRCATLDLKIPTFDKLGGESPDWPWGQTPYLFGGAFVDYLARTYGEDKLAQFNHAYSRGMPYGLNSTAIEIFQKEFTLLWNEWRQSLQKKYEAQYQALAGEGITASEPLTFTGYVTMGPRFSPDGRWLAFSTRDADHYPAIEALNMTASSATGFKPRGTGLKPVLLIPGRNAYTLSWSPDGKTVYISRTTNPNSALAENFFRYYDLFAYRIQKEKKHSFRVKPERLTRQARLSQVDASPDGSLLAGVVQQMDRTELVVLSPDGAGLKPLVPAEPGVRWATPRFSPDSQRIAASVVRAGNRDIVILDREGNLILRVTSDPGSDRDPCWSPDGRYLLFTSARTGIYNLHAFDTEANMLYRVTNVAGGAFQPEVSPDGASLVFVAYSSAGYDLHRLGFDPASWKPLPWEEAPMEVSASEPLQGSAPAEWKDHRYRPFKTLLPRFWLLSYGLYYDFSFISAETMGADALNQHTYLLDYFYVLPGAYSGAQAAYSYDRVWAEFTASYYRFPVYYHDILFAPTPTGTGGIGPEHLEVAERDYYEMEQIASAGFSGTPRILSQALRAGMFYHWEQRDPLSQIPEEVTEALELRPRNAKLVGVEAGLVYSTIGSTGRRGATVRNLGVESGRSLAVGYEFYRRALGGDLDREVVTVDYREYVPIPKLLHHVLAWRVHYGKAWGDDRVVPTFRMGGGYGDLLIPEPGTRFFSLRGFGFDDFWGEEAAAAYLEYRLPLTWAEHGWGLVPLYYYGAHLTLFSDAGMAWGGILSDRLDNPKGFNSEELNLGAGAEIDFRLRLGYGLGSDMIWRLGYADDVQGEGLGGTLFTSLGVSF